MDSAKSGRAIPLRLFDIREEVAVIRRMLATASVEHILDDPVLSRAVERCLSIISEAARHLPKEIEALEPAVPWAKIRGVGNILRHDYERIDRDVIAAILLSHVDPLDEACARLQARFRA
jgi:uncharacterized protein with HEPN domain